MASPIVQPPEGSTPGLSIRPLKIFFDGGCQPNPGKIEVAVVARGHSHFFDDLGRGTSSDAEWLALRLALTVAHTLKLPRFELLGDSANVIAQVTGRAACRSDRATAHFMNYLELARAKRPDRIRWLPRNQNLAGIALARRRSLSSAPGSR
jgi:ribonuclease HI